MKKYLTSDVFMGTAIGIFCLAVLAMMVFINNLFYGIMIPLVFVIICIPIAIINKHFLDLFVGAVMGFICLVLGFAFNTGNTLLSTSIIAAVISLATYLFVRFSISKKNHSKISILGTTLFISGIIIVYFAVLSYGIQMAIASFGHGSGPSFPN